MTTPLKLSEIDELLKKLREFDQIPLEELTLLGDDGTPIHIPAQVLDEWKFIGLNNRFFVEMRYWERSEDKPT